MEQSKKYRKINKNCKNIENPLIYVLKYGILPLDHSGNVRRTKNIYERNPQDMNKTELIEQVAKETEMTKKAAEAAVTAVFEAIAKALENNEEVQVFGFGKFAVNERAAREGRNPATGEKITIAASKYPAFSASKALKDRVNG